MEVNFVYVKFKEIGIQSTIITQIILRTKIKTFTLKNKTIIELKFISIKAHII